MENNNKKVIIVGAGGHAAELDDYIFFDNKFRNSSNGCKIVGFIDDEESKYNKYTFSAPYLGKIIDHEVTEENFYIIGIANLQYRREIIESLISKKAQFISFIHPDAYISRSAEIGIGVVIAPNVNLGPNTKVGNFSMINSRCSIGHDSVIGSFNFLSPNVCLSGNTHVGDENLFGINAATIPGISIGNENKIMAGMTIAQNVKDQEVVFFRYKEKIIAVPK